MECKPKGYIWGKKSKEYGEPLLKIKFTSRILHVYAKELNRYHFYRELRISNTNVTVVWRLHRTLSGRYQESVFRLLPNRADVF